MVGSFFISEKLSASELNKISELSDDEIKKIINKGIDRAGEQIDQLIDDKMDDAADMVERAIEKETNEKIMAISEYSDTVVETMKKTHDEIMFLYSMLNDKHTELTSMTGELQRLAADVRNMQENTPKQEQPMASDTYQTPAQPEKQPVVETIAAEETEYSPSTPAPDFVSAQKPKADTVILENHNDKILQMYQEGISKVDIARKLGLGLGEVSLVIGLYKGEERL